MSKAIIQKIQQVLGVEDDGIWGPKTQGALEAEIGGTGAGNPKLATIQGLIGAAQDGVWGPKSQKALNAAIVGSGGTEPAGPIGAAAAAGAGGHAGAGDKAKIPRLLEVANDPAAYRAVQREAADELLSLAEEQWPHDGCAINLSDLLQAAGIPVPNILQALALGSHLRDHRGWQVIPKGDQQPGDIGSTCGTTANHGADHIYLVLQRVDADEMVIADNQKPFPHQRFVSGKNKTPTKFFLRAT